MTRLPTRRPGIVRRKVDEEVLLFDPESQRAHFLNPTAELVWDLCDGVHGEEDMAVEVASRYEVDRDRALHDVRILLAQFWEKKLLR
ncbi:MAG: PqqD family protein [bacterium]